MSQPTKARHITQTEQAAQKRRAGIAATMRAIAYQRRTGLCPVCKVNPSRWYADGTQGMACSDACMVIWIPGRRDMHEEAVQAKQENENQEDESQEDESQEMEDAVADLA